MPEETILHLMLNHHALLWTLFIAFKDDAKENSPKTSASLSEFVWETKKHFFTEENAIFDYLPLKSMDVLETINHLKDEHLKMLSMLEKFSKSLSLGRSQTGEAEIKMEDVDRFHYLLESHREMEEKKLYPKLDKELAVVQRRQIVSRIEEIPMGAYKK